MNLAELAEIISEKANIPADIVKPAGGAWRGGLIIKKYAESTEGVAAVLPLPGERYRYATFTMAGDTKSVQEYESLDELCVPLKTMWDEYC